MYTYADECTDRAEALSAVLFLRATADNNYSPELSLADLARLTGYAMSTVKGAFKEVCRRGGWDAMLISQPSGAYRFTLTDDETRAETVTENVRLLRTDLFTPLWSIRMRTAGTPEERERLKRAYDAWYSDTYERDLQASRDAAERAQAFSYLGEYLAEHPEAECCCSHNPQLPHAAETPLPPVLPNDEYGEGPPAW